MLLKNVLGMMQHYCSEQEALELKTNFHLPAINSVAFSRTQSKAHTHTFFHTKLLKWKENAAPEMKNNIAATISSLHYEDDAGGFWY